MATGSVMAQTGYVSKDYVDEQITGGWIQIGSFNYSGTPSSDTYSAVSLSSYTNEDAYKFTKFGIFGSIGIRQASKTTGDVQLAFQYNGSYPIYLNLFTATTDKIISTTQSIQVIVPMRVFYWSGNNGQTFIGAIDFPELLYTYSSYNYTPYYIFNQSVSTTPNYRWYIQLYQGTTYNVSLKFCIK